MAGIIFVLPRSVRPDSLGRTVTFYVWTILFAGWRNLILGPVLGSCDAVGVAHLRQRSCAIRFPT